MGEPVFISKIISRADPKEQFCSDPTQRAQAQTSPRVKQRACFPGLPPYVVVQR